MIENLPSYISTIFILTTFLTAGIFLFAVRQTVFETVPAKLFSFVLAFWLFFQAMLGISGFYLETNGMPPRLILFGVLPTILLIFFYFLFTRKNFIERLPLRLLTFIHIIRIPVEIVLLWLFQQDLIPQIMTFEGRNFDILAGLSAPVISWFAFRQGKVNRTVLIVWNFLSLALLFNIVIIAVLSFPFEFQQFGLEQPNRAVLYFPFNWLPTIVVPLVLFSHLISLWKLFINSLK